MDDFPLINDLPGDDTIVAIATPPGRGALAILRISGPCAFSIADGIWGTSIPVESYQPGQAKVGELILPELHDTGVITVWKAPKSYTGQDIVELTLHASPPLIESAENRIIELGARSAAPGEFTFRAIINGKIEVHQAGAIAALIDSPGISAAKAASRTLAGEFKSRMDALIKYLAELRKDITAEMEFPEDVESFNDQQIISRAKSIQNDMNNLLQDIEIGEKNARLPIIVIAGPPNVGKSTLANALLRKEMSIVHPQPGTTRDLIEGECKFGGSLSTIIDTAGLRETDNGVELIGVDLAYKKLDQADIILLIFDGSTEESSEEKAILERIGNRESITVFNKTDLGLVRSPIDEIVISARDNQGLDKLREAIESKLIAEECEGLWVGGWQKESLQRAINAIESAFRAMSGNSWDAAQGEFEDAERNLRLAIGENAPQDIISVVLKDFCIGK